MAKKVKEGVAIMLVCSIMLVYLTKEVLVVTRVTMKWYGLIVRGAGVEVVISKRLASAINTVAMGSMDWYVWWSLDSGVLPPRAPTLASMVLGGCGAASVVALESVGNGGGEMYGNKSEGRSSNDSSGSSNNVGVLGEGSIGRGKCNN